jgi:putative SOS response-associated peptidase YedK
MCGRYALYGPKLRTRAKTEYFSNLEQFPDSWNVAPTHMMPITRLRDGAVEQINGTGANSP